jgi:transketolase
MFSLLKGVWRKAKTDVALEARAEAVSKEVAELLRSYERMDDLKRHAMKRAFHVAKLHLEKAIGDPANWNAEDKVKAAATLMENARKGVDVDPRNSMGIALLSLFYEAQTLPGGQAELVMADIEKWYRKTATQISNVTQQEF